MSNRRVSSRIILLTQLLVLVSIAVAWLLLPDFHQRQLLADVRRKPLTTDVVVKSTEPIRIEPLYDDPEVVSDEELAAVLKKILPRFNPSHLRPNYIEHALRTWGARIEFSNEQLMSGPQMVEFLTDSAKYVESWGSEGKPILEPNEDGVVIRYASEQSSSVHHDHLLASLTEAGVSLSTPVLTPRRAMTFGDVLNQAFTDFRLDERETEWSVMAFGFWLAPQHQSAWRNGEGREITLDLLADRLMRNHKKHGVCLGTHRVYSLTAMLRLNETYGGDLISPETVTRITRHLESVRDLIRLAQCDDGSWPPNWTDGEGADSKTDPKEKWYRRVIATGHHLEWLAIAPPDLHPDREQVRRAADWIIQNVAESSQSTINDNFTFYSHVGNGLALWRKTTPEAFWTKWRESHTDAEVLEELPEPAAAAPGSASGSQPEQGAH